MTVELKPMGVACNLACQYCYQARLREMQVSQPYDLDKMLLIAASYKTKFSIFGGEPLLIPKADLERIFEVGLNLNDKLNRNANSIQTNGTLIDDDHIAMFKQYKVGVGISIDGPQELNIPRKGQDADLVMRNICKLREVGIAVSIISVLHHGNGLRLDKFKEFGLRLLDEGVCNVNIHFMQRMPEAADIALTDDEEVAAFLDLAHWLEGQPRLRWNPFLEIKQLLAGDRQHALCHWNACDPYYTCAVIGIEADGHLSNCGRVAQLGINWVKPGTSGMERQIVLKQASQEHGGCKGCRFFVCCTGGCPGDGIDSDWRNRTSHCPTIKALMRYYEDLMLDASKMPITTTVTRLAVADGCGHGDSHGDIPHGDKHGDAPHGDAPHGDRS